jgi:hypothetical protein
VHGDPRAALDSAEDPRRAVAQPAEGVERMPRRTRTWATTCDTPSASTSRAAAA